MTSQQYFNLCGDLNARLGNIKDTNNCVGEIRQRFVNNKQNQHGKAFIDFLNDSRCCILNGRLGEKSNTYTFLSTHVCSVLDCISVPRDAFSRCTNSNITA
jgi:hypothetical protein